jgi:parallel beta-helix repeat protein
VLVDGNEAYNIGASGIVVHAHNAQVTNNYSHGNVGSGIKFVPKDINSGLVTVSGNNIDGNAFNGLQIGTRIKCQFEIFDNVFNNTTIGIYVGDGVDAPISITNNYFTNNTSQAIYFYDANDLTIANNRFSENQVSILLHGDPGRVINNVTISTNNIVGSNFIGVQVLGRGGAVTTMAINGNSIVDSSSYGVIIEYTSGTVTGITHSGNCFKNNGTNLLDQRGILSNPASSGSCSDPSTGWGAEPQPPTVSLTTPAAGTVSGIVTVSATAADDVAVVGVQFKLDGVNLQAEDTSAPYSISWDTLGVLNGPHVLTAVARDGSGNSTVSASVNVTVSNIGAPRGLEILNGVKRRGRVEFGPVAVNIIFWSTLTSSQWASLTSSQWATLVP